MGKLLPALMFNDLCGIGPSYLVWIWNWIVVERFLHVFTCWVAKCFWVQVSWCNFFQMIMGPAHPSLPLRHLSAWTKKTRSHSGDISAASAWNAPEWPPQRERNPILREPRQSWDFEPPVHLHVYPWTTQLRYHRIWAKLPATQRLCHQCEWCREAAVNYAAQQSRRTRPDTMQDTQGTSFRARPHTNGYFHSIAPDRPNTIEVVYSKRFSCVQEGSNLSTWKLPSNQPDMCPLQVNGAHYLPPHPRPPG